MLSLATLALLPLAMAVPATKPHPSGAPIIFARNAHAGSGNFIVALKGGRTSSGNSAEAFGSGKTGILSSITKSSVFSTGVNGFAAKLNDEELAALASDPDVDYIEESIHFHTSGARTVRPRAGAYHRRQGSEMVTQKDAPWGLARISHREPGAKDYNYAATAGEGTCIYIIDTGIQANHTDFEDRAELVANYIEDSEDTDEHGHGTHVAGSAAGKTYGVAKKARVFGVKVLDARGGGETEGVLAGMDFAVKDSKARQAQGECKNGVVVNMSLGSDEPSQIMNSAAAAIVREGLFLAVAAGNEGVNAQNASPASEPSACTVGATDKNDKMAVFSNWGKLVDIFAPGVAIKSSWIGESGEETNTIQGTSMASPHIAGLAAYLLAELGPRNGTDLCDYMRSISSTKFITNLPNGTDNMLAYNGHPTGKRGSPDVWAFAGRSRRL